MTLYNARSTDFSHDRGWRFLVYSFHTIVCNKKHLENVGPIRHSEPPHALILHCHSPGVATVARRLRIDVHDNDNNNNDNAWQRGPLWPRRMGPTITLGMQFVNHLSPLGDNRPTSRLGRSISGIPCMTVNRTCTCCADQGIENVGSLLYRPHCLARALSRGLV